MIIISCFEVTIFRTVRPKELKCFCYLTKFLEDGNFLEIFCMQYSFIIVSWRSIAFIAHVPLLILKLLIFLCFPLKRDYFQVLSE